MRLRIGYMIQEGGLFPHLTARDNAAIMPRYLGWEQGRTAERLKDLLELTQLPAGLLDRYPRQLSGGQRQRVSLMRALMLDPDVLLLDEPLGDLDPMIRAELQQDLRTIFRELDKTVVLVTHDLGEAGYLGDTITLLRAGRDRAARFLRRIAGESCGRFCRKICPSPTPGVIMKRALIIGLILLVASALPARVEVDRRTGRFEKVYRVRHLGRDAYATHPFDGTTGQPFVRTGRDDARFRCPPPREKSTCTPSTPAPSSKKSFPERTRKHLKISLCSSSNKECLSANRWGSTTAMPLAVTRDTAEQYKLIDDL